VMASTSGHADTASTSSFANDIVYLSLRHCWSGATLRHGVQTMPV
jgi:hypothetical protein